MSGPPPARCSAAHAPPWPGRAPSPGRHVRPPAAPAATHSRQSEKLPPTSDIARSARSSAHVPFYSVIVAQVMSYGAMFRRHVPVITSSHGQAARTSPIPALPACRPESRHPSKTCRGAPRRLRRPSARRPPPTRLGCRLHAPHAEGRHLTASRALTLPAGAQDTHLPQRCLELLFQPGARGGRGLRQCARGPRLRCRELLPRARSHARQLLGRRACARLRVRRLPARCPAEGASAPFHMQGALFTVSSPHTGRQAGWRRVCCHGVAQRSEQLRTARGPHAETLALSVSLMTSPPATCAARPLLHARCPQVRSYGSLLQLT